MSASSHYATTKEEVYKDLTSLFDGSMYKDFSKWIKLGSNADDGNIYATVWGLVKNVFDIFLIAGILLSLVYFVSYILDKVTHQEVTIESMARSILELALALLLISNAWNVSQAFMNLGDAIYDETASTFNIENGNANTAFIDDMYKDLTDDSDNFPVSILKSTYLKLLYGTKYMPISIGTTIASVAMVAAGITRGVTIIIYTIYFPLGIANIYGNGLHSPGMRYMKKYAAACISGAIMVAISVAGQAIQVAILNTDGVSKVTGPIYSLAVTFVVVTMMFKSQSFANDIVGV